jgi:lipopolysaccharide biosynthesis glycosyltransferase
MTATGGYPVNPPVTNSGLQDGQSVEIALTFDDNFWAPAYATMRSVCLSSKHPARIRFHLVHTGLTPEHAAVLESIGTDYGAQLTFIDISHSELLKSRIAAFPAIKRKDLNPIVYARLFLGEVIDAAVKRLLFLDCDLFIRGPLDGFYTMDMAGHALCGVQQPDRFHCVAGRDLKARSAMSVSDPYFNAGVLLIDLEQYRQMDFARMLTETLAPDELSLFYYDQDIINYCFRGRILEIAERWNLQNPIPAHEAYNPIILHYSTGNKPWFAMSHVAFKRTYRHLMTSAYYYQFRRERLARGFRKLLRLA